MKNIRISREYLVSTPVFCSDPDCMGHVDIDDLMITEALKKELKEWNDAYQSTFNEDYPPNSGFLNIEANAMHDEMGKRLAVRLQIELGCDFRVEYVA